jgi:hypothetical protein
LTFAKNFGYHRDSCREIRNRCDRLLLISGTFFGGGSLMNEARIGRMARTTLLPRCAIKRSVYSLSFNCTPAGPCSIAAVDFGSQEGDLWGHKKFHRLFLSPKGRRAIQGEPVWCSIDGDARWSGLVYTGSYDSRSFVSKPRSIS